MGHEHQLDRGVEAEGAPPPDAGHVHQGRDPGQERVEEPLRLPRLQDPAEGPHLRVDVQPQDKGETGKVDPGGSRVVTSDLTRIGDLRGHIVRTVLDQKYKSAFAPNLHQTRGIQTGAHLLFQVNRIVVLHERTLIRLSSETPKAKKL